MENFLANRDYKEKLRQTVNEAFKFNDLVVDELHKEMEPFLNIFNNVFKAHQLCSQHAYNIIEIESSIEQGRTKLIQAQEGFPKAKENIMSIQGPMEKIEKSEEDLVKQKEELLAKLRPIQDEL